MPNRIIKESICTSETLNSLTDFEENFFYKLIVNCDDYGRFDARLAILKSRLYPLRERLTLKNIEDALSSLARVGCVELYEVDGKPFLRLPTWEVHQQVRAKKSKYPAPGAIGNQLKSDDIKCPRNPIQSESNNIADQVGEKVDFENIFSATYAEYPRKDGKAKGKISYLSYLNGKKKIGTDCYRFNHQQIYIAVMAYSADCEGKDRQFIKQFDTFMNGAVLDYIERTRDDYEAFMQEKYGDGWEDVRFVYV